MKAVIDSGILMNTNYLPDIKGDIYIPPDVYAEIKSKVSASLLHAWEGTRKIIQIEPDKQFIAEINQKATAIGQQGLSSQDIQVLALALMLSADDKVILYSDDFGLRNVAHECQITSKSVTVRGGSKKYTYQFECNACGALYQQLVDDCDICGHTSFTKIRKYPSK